jgi:hypothetical protein
MSKIRKNHGKLEGLPGEPQPVIQEWEGGRAEFSIGHSWMTREQVRQAGLKLLTAVGDISEWPVDLVALGRPREMDRMETARAAAAARAGVGKQDKTPGQVLYEEVFGGPLQGGAHVPWERVPEDGQKLYEDSAVKVAKAVRDDSAGFHDLTPEG